MRILICGGDGMLGHQLLRYLSPRYDVRATVHKDLSAYKALPGIAIDRLFPSIDVRAIDSVDRCVSAFRPDMVINATGVVKQRTAAKDTLTSLEVNSLFPHRLARLADRIGARVVHFSTDCVFTGEKGLYTEDDASDATDVYGRTKLLGELEYPHCATLRTSIVGRELFNKTGLLEWFLAERAVVKGFTHAIFSGFTTLELSRIVERIISNDSAFGGMWHVSSEPISKHDLLRLFREYFAKNIEIVPDGSLVCDRSLDSSRFRSAMGYTSPPWHAMVAELASDGAVRS